MHFLPCKGRVSNFYWSCLQVIQIRRSEFTKIGHLNATECKTSPTFACIWIEIKCHVTPTPLMTTTVTLLEDPQSWSVCKRVCYQISTFEMPYLDRQSKNITLVIACCCQATHVEVDPCVLCMFSPLYTVDYSIH